METPKATERVLPQPTDIPEWHQLTLDQKRLYKGMNRAYRDMFLSINGHLVTDEPAKDQLRDRFFRVACDFVLALNDDLQNIAIGGMSKGYNPEVHN